MADRSRERGKYLDALAFRCTPDLIGDATVHLRLLDEPTSKLWADFDRAYGREESRAPYSIATTVLSVITGGYVHFEPRRTPFIASRTTIDDDLLCKVFTLTYGLALGTPVEEIDLLAPPALAEKIAGTAQLPRSLAEYVAGKPGVQPNVPGWVFKTIGWDLSQRLAQVRFAIEELPDAAARSKKELSDADEPDTGSADGPDTEPEQAPVWDVNADGRRTVRLLPDTTGGLVALQAPWLNESKTRRAVSRTALILGTRPNITEPILLLDSKVTRISGTQVYSSTALAWSGGSLPVWEVKLNGHGGARSINRKALEALGRLQMDYDLLLSIDKRREAEQKIIADARAANERPVFPTGDPAPVWPVLGKNYAFSIGVGVGMEHQRLLQQHFMTVFGDAAQPLEATAVAMTFPHRPTDPERVSKQELDERRAAGQKPLRPRGSAFPDPEAVMASVEAGGFKKLRLACLWYRDETRLRMLGTLAKVFGLDPDGLDPADGQELPLYGDRITATFHCLPEFLQPGPGGADGRREALASSGVRLESRDGVLAGAWCETEIPSATDDDGDDEAAQQVGDEVDGKLSSKPALCRIGTASQYLLGRNAVGVIKPKGDKQDHPAEAALLDLYRSLGVVDGRIASALAPDKSKEPVDRIAHVGFHIRQQNRRKGERGEPKVVITATALVPPAADGAPWTMLGWSATRPVWQDYRTAQTSFHAIAYPTAGNGGGYRDRWDEAAGYVERALQDLAEALDGVDYTISVEETQARRCWDGIQNVRQGTDPGAAKSKYWLPGSSLTPSERPLAVIRVNIDPAEVVQPVSTRYYKDADADAKVGDTTTGLYEIGTDFGSPLFVLCNVPRAFDGKASGRLGAEYTRWDAKRSVWSENKEDRRKGEMGENWYSMTATEIFPIVAGSAFSPRTLAVTTAKLCHQAQFWSDRARLPIPMHAARQMDEDHPQYRRTAAPEPKLVEELGAVPDVVTGSDTEAGDGQEPYYEQS